MGGGVGQTHLPIKRPTDFYTEVEKGNVPGHSIVHKFGHGTVGTTMAPLCISGFYRTPTSLVSLEFLSDNANDTALGSGAREITYTGIGENYDEVTFSIDTNGTTPVPLPTDLLRLYRWYVSKSGTYATPLVGSHDGALETRVAGAGEVWSQIELTPFPAGQSEIGAYTVPDGFNAFVIQQEIHVDATKTVDVVLFKRNGIDVIVAPFEPMRMVSHYVGVTGINPTDFKAPVDDLPARTDVGYMAKVTAQTADISVHFSIMLIKDGY